MDAGLERPERSVMHKTARAWWVRGSALGSLPSFVFTPAFARGYSERDKRRKGRLRHRQLTGSKAYFGGFGGALVVVITSATPLPPDLFTAFFAAYVG